MKVDWIYINDVPYITKCLHAKQFNGFVVPCGKCRYCRRKQAKEWAIRLKEECRDAYAYNVLLTYDEDFLPKYKGEPCVNKVHIQGWLKRFRYWIDKVFKIKCRFFLVGEYGGQFHRPHYHMILITTKPLEVGDLSFAHLFLQETWHRGFVNIERLNNAQAQTFYMTAYMLNHVDGHKYNKYTAPFRLMSRRPGIGFSFLEDAKRVLPYIRNKNWTYCDENGYKNALPRFYKRKLQSEEDHSEEVKKYYELCNQYRILLKQILKTNPYEYYKKHREAVEQEKRRENIEYRNAKIHRDNRCAGRLFKNLR